jgi:hypothetical protein
MVGSAGPSVEDLFVTEETREWILSQIRSKGKPRRERMLRMVAHVLSGWTTEIGGIMFDGRRVLEIYGRKGSSKNSSAAALAEEFSSSVFPVRLTEWSRARRKCRKMIVVLPPSWYDVLEADLRSGEDLVGLVSGEPLDRERLERERLQRAAEEEAESGAVAASPEIREMVDRLNALPLETFLPVLQGLPEALEVARGLEDEDARRSAFAALRKIRELPKPVYKLVAGCDRAYTVGTSFLGLHGPIRDALLSRSGWASYDMEKAQLRIAAKIWDIPELEQALQGGDLWERVLVPVGLWSEDSAACYVAKRAAKELMYGILFGSPLMEVRKRLYSGRGFAAAAKIKAGESVKRKPAICSFEDARRLAESPLVLAVHKAASRQRAELKRGAAMKDAFGKDWRLESRLLGKVDRATSDEREAQCRAICARVAQSYEVACMIAAGSLPLAWLHDGIWVRPEDLRIAEGLVESRARWLGIPYLQLQSLVGPFQVGEVAALPLHPQKMSPTKKLGMEMGRDEPESGDRGYARYQVELRMTGTEDDR